MQVQMVKEKSISCMEYRCNGSRLKRASLNVLITD